MDYRRYWEQGMSYEAYRALIAALHAEDKTTGSNHSPEMLEYSRLNEHRMERVEKRFLLSEALGNLIRSLESPLRWLVLSEAWCGDAAQNVPALHHVSALSGGKIEMRLLLRDEHPELMDQWLTNGGKSIPKLIQLDANFDVCGSWGPRPAEAQRMVNEARAAAEDHHVYAERIHKWYAQNNSADLQVELCTLLSL
ncbi:MAG: thioredoxin family protein [Bacteroidetes bacterium]|nr:thioredoxin family protein [Bacteroidota bacterium]